MYYVLITVHVIACLLLIIVVLLQAGRGGGMSGAFGVSDNQMIFGSRAGDFLTKSTTTMAVLFMIGSLLLAIISSNRSSSVMKDVDYQAEVPQTTSVDSTAEDLSDITVPIGSSDPVPKMDFEQDLQPVMPDNSDPIPGGQLVLPVPEEE